MSYNPEYSYWIDISGPADKIEQAKVLMAQNDTIAESFVMEQNEYGDLHYEINDGTIERWANMESELAAVATAIPDITMTVEEINEETRLSLILLTFTEGKLASKKYGRMLDPDQLDIETVRHCISLLEKAGMQDAATFLKEQHIVI